MRLVCPSCEAKYEVPDDAIPDTGRDVQCTACNHTWFQMRGRTTALVPSAPSEPEAEPEPEAVAEPAREPVVEPVPVEPAAEATADEAVTAAEAVAGASPVAAPRPEPEPEGPGRVRADPVASSLTDESVPRVVSLPETEGAAAAMAGHAKDDAADAAFLAEPVLDADPAAEVAAGVIAKTRDLREEVEAASDSVAKAVAEPAVAAATAPAAAYAVDESVMAILREEAVREANARRAEALQGQTDLGIAAAMPREEAALADAEAKPTARRDLLPDVEEINSTLRPSQMQADDDGTPDFAAPPPEAPRSFRSGFLTLMTIAILAAALYLVAPRLAVTVPSLAGLLEGYVFFIDGLRLGLDGIMRSATVAISDG